MLDIWPNQALEIDSEMLMRPLVNLTLGVAGAVVLFIALLRFLPGGGPWGGMILQAAVAGEPGSIRPVNAAAPDGSEQKDLVGSEAIAATDLYPSGQVTIDGKRYEARLEVGTVDAGTRLVVTRASQFGLIVEQASTQEEAKS
jgi:membrane-bound serine protease (ClpP class)